MEIKFDPLNTAERDAIAALLVAFGPKTADKPKSVVSGSAPVKEPAVQTAAPKLAVVPPSPVPAAVQAAASANAPAAAHEAADRLAGQHTQTPAASAADPLANVRRAVQNVGAKNGRDAAVALLKEFGAVSVPTLKAEHYAALVARANELTTAQPAA